MLEELEDEVKAGTSIQESRKRARSAQDDNALATLVVIDVARNSQITQAAASTVRTRKVHVKLTDF